MASWQVLSLNHDIYFFDSRVTTVNISHHQNINVIKVQNNQLLNFISHNNIIHCANGICV